MTSNQRLLCLPSEGRGEDWLARSQKIDEALAAAGLELAEESIYLLYSHPPLAALDGQGTCLVARPFIGPKKSFEGELTLLDWVAAPVYREGLKALTLEELLLEANGYLEKAQRALPRVKKAFTLCIRRRLLPSLFIQTEVIFNE